MISAATWEEVTFNPLKRGDVAFNSPPALAFSPDLWINCIFALATTLRCLCHSGRDDISLSEAAWC